MEPLTPEMIRREDNEALGGVVQRSNLVFRFDQVASLSQISVFGETENTLDSS